jgi:hypothetical protein
MARRRTKRDDMITPIPTPDKQLEHPSGWCMTDDHVDCKYQFNHGKCGCSCHAKTQKTQNTEEPIASIVPAPRKRGRPRKEDK